MSFNPVEVRVMAKNRKSVDLDQSGTFSLNLKIDHTKKKGRRGTATLKTIHRNIETANVGAPDGVGGGVGVGGVPGPGLAIIK
jgi:hypothetical protein